MGLGVLDVKAHDLPFYQEHATTVPSACADRYPELGIGQWPPVTGGHGRTGELPDEHDIGWAIHETSNLCRALGLLASGGDWRDRSYGLTSTGRATALAALRARAAGPRTIPWP